MPYRRLPKTDAARLRALKTLLDNNEIYTVRNRFIDWKTLNRAQPAYDKLLTASEQYKVSYAAQLRGARVKATNCSAMPRCMSAIFCRCCLWPLSVEK